MAATTVTKEKQNKTKQKQNMVLIPLCQTIQGCRELKGLMELIDLSCADAMINDSLSSDEDACIAGVMVSDQPRHLSTMVVVRIEIVF